MKKKFFILLILFTSFKLYSSSISVIIGLESQSQSEFALINDNSQLSLFTPSFGLYISSVLLLDEKPVGAGFSYTFRNYYMTNTAYYGNRVLLGPVLFPFKETAPVSILSGIILQPEVETSSHSSPSSFFLGVGTDIQIISSRNNFGLGGSLNLSAYPFAFVKNSKQTISKYNRFSIGFTIGGGCNFTTGYGD